MLGDADSGAIWAAGGGDWHGAGVWRSLDHGQSWSLSKLAGGQADAWAASDPAVASQLGMEAGPPAPFTDRITALWSLGYSNGTVYAGAKPATLFASRDGGASWNIVQGLSDHPSNESWQPGAVGLTLHTILSDPGDGAKLWVGISAAAVFASEDGGQTWDRRNRLSNAVAPGTHSHPAAPCGSDTGLCVQNLVRTPGETVYQQNHHGTYRSRDGGRNWDDITHGLPSTFGFPIAVDPGDPDTIWVVPLNGDNDGRFAPGGRAAVWRSRDGGETWERLTRGLPEQAFFTVLRQGMATDAAGGVFFGTNSGSVFASRDKGESWDEVARHLPTVLSVETLSVT